MTLSEKQRIFTFNVHKLIEWAYLNGFMLTFGEVWRTKSQVLLNYYGYEVGENDNHELYLIKTTPKSRTLKSKHLDRLAVDFNVFINGILINDAAQIKPLGEYWESLHTDNEWGGKWETFVDANHFQMN